MNLHLFSTEHWHELHRSFKEEWSKLLGHSQSFSVRVFADMSSALYEISHGSAQFYSHKKSILIQDGSSPYLSHLSKLFLREGYNVQNLNKSFQEPEKDLLFALMQADHPFTGEKFDWTTIVEKLDAKKVLHFMVHHQLHEVPQVRPYSVHLIQGEKICLALCGERFKTPHLFTEMKNWDGLTSQVAKEMAAFNDRIALEADDNLKKAIMENEALFPLPENLRPLVLGQRYFDRSLLCLRHANSDVVRTEIRKHFPHHEPNVQSLNLCRENMVFDQIKWWAMPFDAAMIPSLLILGPAPSLDKKFVEWLSVQDAAESRLEFEVKI